MTMQCHIKNEIAILVGKAYDKLTRKGGRDLRTIRSNIMCKIKPMQLLFLLKVALGSALSIWIAGSFGLLYSPSAGIITLLSIQNTRRETLSIAVRRLLAFLLSIGVAYIVFSLMGYTFAAFGVFLLFFVGLCLVIGLQEGISMNAVLMTHFLVEGHMKPALIGNEVLLLIIGMGIGILINMIMPKYKDKIRREQTEVEKEMKRILSGLADTLRSKEACLIQGGGYGSSEEEGNMLPPVPEDIGKGVEFTDLDFILEGLLIKAYEDVGNTILNNTKYLVAYLEMRKLQVEVLKSIAGHIGSIPVILRQSLPLADFLEHVSASFHELNNAIGLLAELKELNRHYKKEALPVTREEFEYRATLFQVLKELEYFLLLKRNFVKELEKKNMKGYWN